MFSPNLGALLACYYPEVDCSAVQEADGTISLAWRDPAVPRPSDADLVALEWQWLKERKQSDRQSARLAAQTGGFTFDGARYASDREESIPLLTAATLAAQSALAQGPEAAAAYEAALGAGWRSEDGVARIASAVGILSLHAAFVAHGAACDRHSQVLKAAIEAATTVAELDAIDLSAGWPG